MHNAPTPTFSNHQDVVGRKKKALPPIPTDQSHTPSARPDRLTVASYNIFGIPFTPQVDTVVESQEGRYEQ